MLQIVVKYFKLLQIVAEKFASFGVVPLSLISSYPPLGKFGRTANYAIWSMKL